MELTKTQHNLENKRFGNWLVLEYRGNRKWACRCSVCGIEKDIATYTLVNGKIPSCKHTSIVKETLKLGDRFGEWEVSSDKIVNNKVMCKCTCGVSRYVSIYTLTSGKSTSCGHSMNKDKIIDITGSIFGELKVIKYLGYGKWECMCSCGNTTIKTRSHLIDGRALRCERCYQFSPLDISKRKFGKLKPIEYVGDKKWICKCDCGNSKEILSANLVNNSTISCGCVLYTPTCDYLLDVINKIRMSTNKIPTIYDLASSENISYKTMYYHINKYKIQNMGVIDTKFTSQMEIELRDYVVKLIGNDKVQNNVRNIINPYELDIFIPDKNIAIDRRKNRMFFFFFNLAD